MQKSAPPRARLGRVRLPKLRARGITHFRVGTLGLLAIASCLLVLVPGLVAAELSARGYEQRRLDDARQRAIAGLDAAAGTIDTERIRASNNAELAAGRLGRLAGGGASDELVKALADLRGPVRTTLVAVVDGNGRVVASDPASNLPFQTFYEVRQALQGKLTIGLQDRAPGLAVQAAAPLRIDGEIVPGAAVAALNLDDTFLNTALRVTGQEMAVIQNGRLVAASRGLRRSFAYASDQTIDGDLLAGGADRFKRARLGGEDFFLAARTLRAGERELATLLVGSAADGADDDVFGARALGFAAAGLGALTAGLLGWLAGWRLAGQVDAHAGRVRAIGAAVGAAPLASEYGDSPRSGTGMRPVDHGERERNGPSSAGATIARPRALGALWAGLDAAIVEVLGTVAAQIEAHRLRAARLESTFGSLAEGVIVADEGHHVVLANPAARTLLSLPPRGDVPLLDALPTPGDGAPESRANERVIRSYSATVHGDDGATLGYVTVLRDATREQEVERMKSEFLSVVSHELQTPLTAVKGALDLVVEDDTGQLSRVQRKFLDTIDRNCARLIGLVADLLDLSRLDAGRIELDPWPIDAASVVGSCAAALANLFEGRNLRVRIDVPLELPPLLGDRRRVEQIVTNLLANAAKYTPVGGSIEVTAWVDDGHVANGHVADGQIAIAVADNGPGIPAAERELVFDRFYRGRDALRRGEAGSGLGLAIVKSLTDLHNGSVVVEDAAPGAPSRGARFVVRLPRAPEDE